MNYVEIFANAFAETARITASFLMKESALALESLQEEAKRGNDFLGEVIASKDAAFKTDKVAGFLAESIQRSTKSVSTSIERSVEASREIKAAFQAVKA